VELSLSSLPADNTLREETIHKKMRELPEKETFASDFKFMKASGLK
jgi:hypothetical protein